MNRLSRTLPYIVTALVLVLCLLLPLLFRAGPEAEPVSPEGPGLAERAAIFLDCREERVERHSLDEAAVSTEALVECRRTINRVYDALVMDEGEERSGLSEGTRYYSIPAGSGEVRIMEYYREWVGDWSNWFTIQLDIDTLEIYYCYYSGLCERNFTLYAGTAEADVGAALETLPEELGFTGCEAEETADEQYRLTLSRPGGGCVYDCRCHIYEDAGPSLLVDLELTIESAS